MKNAHLRTGLAEGMALKELRDMPELDGRPCSPQHPSLRTLLPLSIVRSRKCFRAMITRSLLAAFAPSAPVQGLCRSSIGRAITSRSNGLLEANEFAKLTGGKGGRG